MTTPESTVEAVEPDMSWFDIAVTHKREAIILGSSPGWKDFSIEHWWEDTFINDAPTDLAPGAYRWTDFEIGGWDEGDLIDVSGGSFASLPAAADHEPAADKYLVWSNEHSAWWGRDRCGYTRIIANAGRYSRAEALCIAGTRDGGWHVRKGNPDEIAIPERDALDQYADITRDQEAAIITRARKIGGEA